MFTTQWQTSPRAHASIRERGCKIPVSAGFELDCDIVRPAENGTYPVILSFSPFPIDDQFTDAVPTAMRYYNAHMEAGDPHFYARHGYVHIIGNLRGTGKSGGEFDHMGPDTIQDLVEVVDWASKQPWSSGKVGTFGMSYFAMPKILLATLAPPALRAIFAPFAVTDQYRDTYYKGGIFFYGFIKGWSKALRGSRIRGTFAEEVGRDRFLKMVEEAKQDPELAAVPDVMAILDDIDDPVNAFLAELIVNRFDTDHYAQRRVDYTKDTSIPAYFGACWGIYGLHLPAAFRSFDKWSGPKKLTIGPPAYLDRPIVQYQWESLRFFDHWFKDIDTGLMAEKPVQLFVEKDDDWREDAAWPTPDAKFTPFYLHHNGLLYERDVWPDEAPTTYSDAPDDRGAAIFTTPAFREKTQIAGPMVLNLFASTTGSEALFYASILYVDTQGAEHILTRGWLRGSHRVLDQNESTPWLPVHAHRSREPLVPGQVAEFNIEIRPYAILMEPGTKLRLRIRGTDQGDEVPDIMHNHAIGGLTQQEATTVSIQHSPEHPSHLLLPVTRGGRIGTFVSGGYLEPLANAYGTSTYGQKDPD